MSTITKLASVAAGAALTATTFLAAAPAAMASTAPHVTYYANEVTGHRFGPPVTGNAQQAIATLTARYHHDPAELAEAARFAGYRLGGGTKWLIRHPGTWSSEANGFGSYLRASVRQEVQWTSPYRTEYAVAHGYKPTTFGWTSMPNLTRDVLVFDAGGREFDLVMDCGGQMYVPARPIPLPTRPSAAACVTSKGKHGHRFISCSRCRPGTREFKVPGAGLMCLCPKVVHVIVSDTKTVTVTVVKTTTTTDTKSTTTTVDWGVCPKHCKHHAHSK